MKEIPLTQGFVALIDDEDYDLLIHYKWCINRNRNTIYARRGAPSKNGGQVEEKMHRLILDVPKGMQIDHIDGNGLNNQKSNLRIVTNRQNCMNRHEQKKSKYPGVTWSPRQRKWIAQAQIHGKHIHIGTFPTEHRAYFAYLNRINPIETKLTEGTKL